MSLTSYQKKRDFRRTAEPAGKKPIGKSQWQYVVHYHAASHLHYDIRLALDGVLKSWAVPKGPSLDPTQKRLAVEVEDHPLDYASFEGVIPEGQYGAGIVMLWDRGVWRPDGDPHLGLRRGKLEFHLEGNKLHGGWVLIRTRAAASGRQTTWLLMKQKDADSRPMMRKVPANWLNSVKTGRDLNEIAAGAPGRIRDGKTLSREPKRRQRESPAVGPHDDEKTNVKAIEGARRGKLPEVFRPQLAMSVDRPPSGDQWWHETKLDGNRIALRINGGSIHLMSRRMQSWTSRLPHLVQCAKKLAVRSALFDGELVAVRPDGTTSFQSLQTAFRENRSDKLVYYVFDLLYLDGYDLTGCTLESRKSLLAGVVRDAVGNTHAIRYLDHAVGNGQKVFEKARQLGLEGIVCKRRDAPYIAGRGADWLKVKSVRQEEFVIGGYTKPEGARRCFGALLVGYYAGANLVYAGRVGTGFDDATLRDVLDRLTPLGRRASPFAPSAELQSRTRGVNWVAPELVAEVHFQDWTRDGMLRQPSFKGLREDKHPREVAREETVRSPVEAAPDASRHESISAAPKGRQQARGISGGGPSLSSLQVRFTNPDKVLYRDQGVTKLDVAHYYSAVAEWIMPHIEGRPLTLVRCPEGADSDCFYQKHAGKGKVEHLRLIPVRESGRKRDYLVADDLAGLLSLVQMGALEIHVWGARADDIERPDRIVFDLDPDQAVTWGRVVESAKQLKQFFDELRLRTFLKTTGSKGLHIVIPLVRKHSWAEVREFCKATADAIAGGDPERYTSRSTKTARKGKIFIDYLRNSRGATSVAPYSTRARPGATVAVPIEWRELNAHLPSDRFNVDTTLQRLASLRRDPWQEMRSVRQAISAAIRKKLGY